MAEQVRKDLKNLSVGQKVSQEVGIKGAKQAGKAIKGVNVLVAGADVFSGDAERQHRGKRELAGHGMAAAGHGYVNPVDIGDLTSNDPSRRGKAASHIAGDVANYSARLTMQKATDVACTKSATYALGQASKVCTKEVVSAAGRRGAVVATGKGATAAAAARGAAAGASNIGKVASGVTGAAVGVAGIGGQIAGEALGSAIGRALGDEQTGKDVGGLSGSMGAAALAGACVGGPIGAAAGAGVAAVGFGIGKGVEAVAGVFGKVAQGGGWPNNARIVWANDVGGLFGGWGSVEKKAKELVAVNPKQRIAVATYWFGTGYHIKVYEGDPTTPMTFDYGGGDHTSIFQDCFMWHALAQGKFVQAHPNGSVCQRPLYGGAWERFEMYEVEGSTAEVLKVCIKTHHGTYLSVNCGGDVSQAKHNQAWEHFTIVTSERGTIALKTHHGTFLCAHSNGGMGAEKKLQTWEQFRWVDLCSGGMALTTCHS